MDQEILIFNYLDNTCTSKEREQVEQLLEKDGQFLELFLELQQANDLMVQQPLETTSNSFASNVLKTINASEPIQYTQQSTIARLLFPIILTLSVLITLSKVQFMPNQVRQILAMMPQSTALYLIALGAFFITVDFFLVRKDLQKENIR